MTEAVQISDKRNGMDDIFLTLQKEILSLHLRPGDKLSEVDVAARFGVSRQPVRDAFSKLANQDLLVIRPKRATEVKRFSHREIKKARFVRSSVEERVLRLAARHCNLVGAAHLDMALAEQENIQHSNDIAVFGKLDYAFHKILCEIAKADFAFDVILHEKGKVDRLCSLSLSRADKMPELVRDHKDIAEAVKSHDAEAAVAAGMKHLSRLDETITQISQQNADYFGQE